MAYGSWQTGIYKMPESYRDAYHQNGAYDYFWNNGYPLTEYHIKTAKPLQDSLNPFYNNSTNWWKYCFDAGKILNANLQVSPRQNLFFVRNNKVYDRGRMV